jgi:DNA-binding response OmpR family regulator
MMPQLSGPEFHGALLRSVPAQAARLVFIAGGAFSAGTAEGLARAGVPVLEKPFEVDAVRAIVRALVRSGS